MEAKARPIDWTKRLRIIFGLIYVAILVIAAFFFLPDYWYLWLIFVIVVLIRVATWMSKKQVYECVKCKTTFSQEKRRFSLVPKSADLYGEEKARKCPKCGSYNTKLVEAKK